VIWLIDDGRRRLEMSVTPTQDRRRIGTLHTVLASAVAMLVLIALPCASADAVDSAVAPLPASDYTVRPVCPAPAPGHASCLSMRLVARTQAARARLHPQAITHSAKIGVVEKASECHEAYGASCFAPQDLREAYFPGEQPDAPASEPQTIALVDAYNDPNAESDLKVYDEEFALPACTTGNGCFEKINQNGETTNLPFPKSPGEQKTSEAVCKSEKEGESQTEREPKEAACKEVEEAEGWALEISTDIEMARAVCQSNCKILLVEANSAEYSDLEAAEETAVTLGATEISNSWGGAESPADSAAFDHPGIVITASSGDDGYRNWTEAKEAEANEEEYYAGADYPASSPHVVAVGGTKLTLSGGVRQSETVWNEDPDSEGGNEGAGGGGCSTQFAAPEWQRKVPDWASVGCGAGGESKRAVADVSADADPYTGVAVYDSVPYPEEEGTTVLDWVPIGGTSVASPIIASMFALAGGAHNVQYPAKTLYSHLTSSLLYDVTAGGNGKCDDDYASCSGSMNPLSPLFPLDCGQGVLICNAAPGYDGPTGVGTPNGIAAFQPPVEEGKKQTKAEEEKKSKEAEEEKSKKKTEEEEAKRKEEAAAKNPGGDSTTGTSTTGAGSISSANGASGGSSSGTTTPSIAAGAPTIKLTAFALTPSALLALNRARPKVSEVGFAFTLSAAARVRVALAKQVKAHGRMRWQILPDTLTLSAARGRNSRRLNNHNALAPGSYRLTLTPAHGAARSLVFQIG
jgi:hypothetical protein